MAATACQVSIIRISLQPTSTALNHNALFVLRSALWITCKSIIILDLWVAVLLCKQAPIVFLHSLEWNGILPYLIMFYYNIKRHLESEWRRQIYILSSIGIRDFKVNFWNPGIPEQAIKFSSCVCVYCGNLLMHSLV